MNKEKERYKNKVSVIIPVYNAEKYLIKAVESVLMQPVVGEILLIEDKSPDSCLQICRALESDHSIVKVYQHHDKENHGAGASRNLGIEKATCEYIAFLDADDYYLPDRFKKDIEVFNKHPEADGVYNALGFHYYSTDGEKKYNDLGLKKLTGISDKVNYADLKWVLLNLSKSASGHIHLNTLTLKKQIFDHVAKFNTSLRNLQDTEFIIRLSSEIKLFPGVLNKPVGMRGVHDENRVSIGARLKLSPVMFKELYFWAKQNEKSKWLTLVLYYSYLKSMLQYCRAYGKYVEILNTFIAIVWILPKYILFKNVFLPKIQSKIDG